MKKISTAAALVLIAIGSLTSCKRVFNCSCTTTISINDSTASVTTTKREYRTTKSDAKSKCASWSQVSIAAKDTTRTKTDCMFE